MESCSLRVSRMKAVPDLRPCAVQFVMILLETARLFSGNYLASVYLCVFKFRGHLILHIIPDAFSTLIPGDDQKRMLLSGLFYYSGTRGDIMISVLIVFRVYARVLERKE